MIIGLASPRPALSLDDGLARIERLLADAARQRVEIACLPEAYFPGLRGQDFDVIPWDVQAHDRVVREVSNLAQAHRLAVIIGLERLTESGRQIAACVIGADGGVRGHQTKNQLDPSEDQWYVPGDTRQLFQVNGVSFGIVICHEGWRYPETVRWAAARGAKIVFHPQHTGNERSGVRLTAWGAAGNPYYEQAMRMRSIENGVWFASVNYALRFPESATSVIDPSGQCRAYLPYGEEGVLVCDIDPDLATGLLARRYAPERHRDGEAR